MEPTSTKSQANRRAGAKVGNTHVPWRVRGLGVWALSGVFVSSWILAMASAAGISPWGDSPQLNASVIFWTSPHPGWLYVLDPEIIRYRPNNVSQVLLVDPTSGEIKGVIRAGLQPDFALSPDGSHLYILSGGYLSAVDTQSGSVLGNWPVHDPAQIITGLPSPGSLVAGTGNRYVFVLKVHNRQMAGGGATCAIGTFDVQQGAFLPDEARLPTCDGLWEIKALPAERKILAFISYSKDAQIVQIGPGGAALSTSTLALGNPPASGVLLPDGHTLAFLNTQRQIALADTELGRVTYPELGAVTIPPDTMMRPQSLTVSASGGMLYVGYGPASGVGFWSDLAHGVAAFNLGTGQQQASAATSDPFLHLTLSLHGKYLYAISPVWRSIVVLDASSLKELRTISNLGVTPASALVAP